jgi:hypothetical protein
LLFLVCGVVLCHFGSVLLLCHSGAFVLCSPGSCRGSSEQHAGNAGHVSGPDSAQCSSCVFLRAFSAFVFRPGNAAIAATQLSGAEGHALVKRLMQIVR